MKSTKARAQVKRAGEGQLQVILGAKNKFFQFHKWLRDCGKFFTERAGDSETDGANTTRLLQCGNDVVIVSGSRGIEIWNPTVLYDDREGRPAIQRL